MPETISKVRTGPRWRAAVRTAVPFLLVGALWEATAHLGPFPPRLFPPLEDVAAALCRLTVAGILPRHAAESLLRLLAGFWLAAIVGVSLGIAMGRSRLAEDVLLPLVSIGAPIRAWLMRRCSCWFGLGNASAILLVAFVSTFPIDELLEPVVIWVFQQLFIQVPDKMNQTFLLRALYRVVRSVEI